MPKILLTEKLITKGLTCPSNKRRIEYCDTHLPGLYLEVRATSPGHGTFYLRYKDTAGKTCHQKIGRNCDISLKQAREEAKRLRAEIQLGANPRAEAKEKKAVMTWRQYMENIYMPHVKAHLRSWKNLESLNEKYIDPKLGHLRLDAISLESAQKLHRDMVEVHGLSPASADHLAKLLRQAMNYAVRLDLLASSPVSKIRLFNICSREERLMSDLQLKKLMDVLDSDKNRTVCLVVKFLLFTGARVNEALHARWADIDREHRTWQIEATRSKSRRRHAVPLSDAAIKVLDQLRTEGRSDWLFTSSRGDGNQRLTTITKSWQRIREEAGLPQTRIHDLRHQAASHILNSGYSLYVVQQILGHSDPSVTQRYAHLSTATLQEAANSIGTFLDKALEKTGK
jgi:integrase